MKKTIAILLALCMCIGLCACGGNSISPTNETATPTSSEENVQNEQKPTEDHTLINIDDFPFVGMWKQTDDEVYLRVQDDSTMTQEFVLESSSTTTVNGVSSTKISKRIQVMPNIWSIQDDQFMFAGKTPYNVAIDGGDYLLKNDKVIYQRIGEVDYEISLDNSNEEGSAEATPYTVGDALSAEGIELTFTEAGIADDIRVTSNSSGIKITSGPSPEADKQFVYLQGTLKYTGKTSVFPAIGGKVVLDGYEYNVSVSLANEDGTPCSKIEPLDTVIIQIYAHIPVELTQSYEAGEIIFGFNDNFESVDITNCTYLYKVDANTLKP